MSRVKIQKSEIWDNDIPTVCMVCGVNPGQTKHDTQAVHTPLFLAPFGIVGTLISPKKMPFSVVCCNDCKPGYMNEVNTSKLFSCLYTAVLVYALVAIASQTQPLAKAVVGPAIAAFSVMLLNFMFFWFVGRKHAIRCVGMDEGNVSFEFPNGYWGVAYTTYKREKGNRRLGNPHAAAAPTDQAAVPVAPPEPLAPEPKSGGGGLQLENDNLGRIPSDLPEFLAAIKEGDSEKISDIITAGGDISEALPNGLNGLHIASIAGLMQMADMLIRRGLDVNSQMTSGLTAMHLAVQSNNQGMVGLLLAKKGNPNHPNADGRTPLHWCAAVRDDRLDPSNRYKMAKVLLQGGGDITLKDKNGKTPAELADEGGEGKVAEIFR